MTTAEFMHNLERQSIRLEVEGNDLLIDAPEDLLTAEMLEALAGYKAEILEILYASKGTFAERRIEDAEAITWRIQAMKKQMPAKPPYPLLIAREGITTKQSECYSCGDVLTEDSISLCQYCLKAKYVVLNIAENSAKNVAQTA
jgi:hypothetical protein